MITPEKLFFIYNDTQRKHKEGRRPDHLDFHPRKRDRIVTLASLDQDGRLEKETLQKGNATPTICRPIQSRQVSADQLLLYSQKGNKNQFGIMTFQTKQPES